MAEKAQMSRISSVVTRETPDTAVSPALETIMESAIPMVTARVCWIISGSIIFTKLLRVKSGFLLSILFSLLIS